MNKSRAIFSTSGKCPAFVLPLIIPGHVADVIFRSIGYDISKRQLILDVLCQVELKMLHLRNILVY